MKKYEINTTINEQETTVIIFVENGKITEDTKKVVGATLDLMTLEERETVGRKFISDINKKLKLDITDNILANSNDFVKSVLMRIPFDEFKYNATKHTLSVNSPAQKDGQPIYITIIDIANALRDKNKEQDKDHKLKFKGMPTGDEWTFLALFEHYIKHDLSAEHIKLFKECKGKSEDFKKTLKLFEKLLESQPSNTTKTKVLNYFYSLFNAKTNKQVKAVATYTDNTTKKECDVIRDIEHELCNFSSLTKTEKHKDTTMLLYILTNHYITSEQVRNSKSKSSDLDNIAKAYKTISDNAKKSKDKTEDTKTEDKSKDKDKAPTKSKSKGKKAPSKSKAKTEDKTEEVKQGEKVDTIKEDTKK